MEMGNVIKNVKHSVNQRDIVDDTFDTFVGDTLKVIKKLDDDGGTLFFPSFTEIVFFRTSVTDI